MNKINILIIDDSPFCASEEPESPVDKEILAKILNVSVKQIESIEDFGFPVFDIDMTGKYKNFSDYFDLKWLYSTSSIKSYFDAVNCFEDNFGSAMLGGNGYIPDIVVFDYALTGNENNQPKGYKCAFIKKSLDPTATMEDYISKQSILHTSTVTNYEWDLNKKNEDRFGLFAGGIIVERFRHQTPCFGIPATYWESAKLKNTEPGFFEWFLADAFKGVFANPDLKGKTETQKSWQIIIDAAMPEYRNSIIDLIRLGKIQPDLQNILHLLHDGINTFDELAEKNLKFETVYGKRELDLNGLFIDKTFDEIENTFEKEAINEIQITTERGFAVWEFLNKIISALVNDSRSGNVNSELETAINNTNNLLNTFDSDLFQKRILLSYYHDKASLQGYESLNDHERQTYQEYADFFQIIDNEELAYPEYSISTISEKGKRANKLVNRLTAFFVATKLWERYSNFAFDFLQNKEENAAVNYFQLALNPPNVTDFLLALFPVWTGHIVLLQENGTLYKGPREAMGKSKLNTTCDFKYSDFNDVSGIDLRSEMSYEEYLLVKAYAASLNFKKYPKWLKNYNA